MAADKTTERQGEQLDELMDHDYDGIREYNNPLPRWWVWLFYGTILFALIYFPYYVLGWGPSTVEEYTAEMAAAKKQGAPPGGQPVGGGKSAVVAQVPSLEGNPEAVAAGKEIFTNNCTPCHGAEAQGLIGPNLTDDYSLHGQTHAEIVNVITNGVPAKGMIAWKTVLNPQKIQQVAAFVGSLKGSNPPNPKAPQGKKAME